MTSDAEFLRLGRNYVLPQAPVLPDVAVRRRHVLQNFTDVSSTSTEPRRTFLKPCIGCPLTEELPGTKSSRRLRIEESGLLRSLYKDYITPSGYDFLLSGTQSGNVASASSSTLPGTITQTTSNPVGAAMSGATSTASGLSSPGRPAKRARPTESTSSRSGSRLVQQATLSETQVSYPGNLINIDWTCDGTFCVICCKQGIALGEISTAALVSSVTGTFGRIACHPSLPNVFAAISNSASLVVYEISQRPGKPGATSPCYVMKVTAEMKFTSVNLCDRFLEWSPDGTLLVVSNQDKGLYLLTFEDLPAMSSKTQRIRRVLRIVTQSRLIGRPTSVTFADVPLNVENDGCRYHCRTTGMAEILFGEHNNNLCIDNHNQTEAKFTLLYVALEGGRLTAFCVSYKDGDGKERLTEKDLLAESMDVESNNQGSKNEITSLAADPAEGRMLVIGCEDDHIRVMDIESQCTLAALYRTFGPIQCVTLSGGGLFLLWSVDVSKSQDMTGSMQNLNDSTLARPSIKPFVALSTTFPLQFLWKLDLPARVISLKWHPNRASFLVAYESENFTRTSTSASWSAVQSPGGSPPTQGVMIISFL